MSRSRVALLDVNVLVALFDPDHVHHDISHDWFAEQRGVGWATCPLTENGLARVLSSPRVSTGLTIPDIAARLRVLKSAGRHVFWADDVSLTDERLFGWHAALFPTGRSGMTRIIVGAWRDDRRDPAELGNISVVAWP